MTDVAVIGAGAAGLAAGVLLKDAGVDVVVLDGAERAGGKVGTVREGGFLIERAALGLLDRAGELVPIAHRLKVPIWAASKAAKRRWVVRDGKLHALPSGPFSAASTPLLTFREKLRLLREPWVPGKKDGADESVRTFFARRLGPGGAFLADALQTGIYAGDADRLEVAAAFPFLAAAESRAGSLVRAVLTRPKAQGPKRPPARLSSFPLGLSQLMEGLGALLGPALRLRTKATSLRRDGARWKIATDAGELDAARVLIAAPAPQAAELLEPVDAALAARLRELRAAPVTSVHLGVRRADVEGDTRGFGLLSPGRPVLGTLLPASLWPGRAPEGHLLLTTLCGGARHPEVAALPDAELVALVREELARTVRLKPSAQPALVRVVRWPQAVPQYELGHRARIALIEELTARHPGLALTGAWYRGVSVLDCLRDGKRQAERLLAPT